MVTPIIIILIFFAFCGLKTENFAQSQPDRDTCRTIEEAEKLKNKEAVIYGKLQKFTPWEEGKGANHMFWQWEIAFPNGGRIPIVSADKSDGESIIFNEYENQNVIVYGVVFFGIVIGDSNPERQSATGYRIDADGIDIVEPINPRSKITINLDEFNDEGYRERPKGEFSSAHYEFCIPATDEAANEVMSIDSTLGIYKTSKGRSGCSDKEWLCIGATRQKDFKKVILKLAELNYVRKISETFWE